MDGGPQGRGATMAEQSKSGRGGLGARLRYEFDKSMAAGPIALIGWLAVLSSR